MKRIYLLTLPVLLVLSACSSTLSSEDGNDLTNEKESIVGEEKALDDFSITVEDDVTAKKAEPEDSTPPEPEFPNLVRIEEPELLVPAEQDSTNYHLYSDGDNFNNTSITSFAEGAYPSVEEVGSLEDMGTNEYLEGWLTHFKSTLGTQPTTGDMDHGFLNWDNGIRGAYVSYEFSPPSIEMPEGMEAPEGVEVPAPVVEIQPTFFTEFILIKDKKVLVGSSTATELGFPKYLQSLEF